MKKIILSIISLSLLVIGCNSDDGNDGNSCAQLTSLNIVQNAGVININLTTSTGAMHYELSVAHASGSSESGPEQGNIIILDDLSNTIESSSIMPDGYGDNTFVFYARAVCSDNGKSDWIGPKSVTILDYCAQPNSLNMSYDGLYWNSPTAEASYWQVQYGPEGFNLGSGTVKTTSDPFLGGIPMSANTTYDFYVRSNCGATGFSSWTGPYSHYSATAVNMCLAPINLSYTISYMSGSNYGIETSYNGNGESLFEYALMNGTQAPGPGDINTIGPAYTPAFTGLSTYSSYT
ncbi:MAG: hypothetical protein ITG00_11645, partial [Flavobacterium sp.]|nr:hypothetical protein [Flavobacterium sp.]